MGILNMIFETNSQTIIMILKNNDTNLSYLDIVIQDCRFLLSAMNSAHVVFVKRFADMVTHTLFNMFVMLNWFFNEFLINLPKKIMC